MVRVALLGLGKMGISHLAMLRAHPSVEVAAVCDTSEYLLDVVGKYANLRTYTDYRKALAKEQLDAVVVATPSRFHAEMVRAALEANLAVFCEKPFCLDTTEAQQLVELAQAKKLVNQVGYHYRFVGAFHEMKRLLDANVIGKIHNIRAEAYGPVVVRAKASSWRTSKVEGGGCLYDYASHALDLMNYLVGAPETVRGTILDGIFSGDVEDQVYSNFRYANGMTGSVAANWSDDSFRKMSMKVSVWGSNGRLTADRQELQIHLRNPAPSEHLKEGWTVRYTTDLTEEVWYYLRGEEYSAQIDHFIRACVAKDTNTRSTFATAIEADLIAAAMVRDAAGGDSRVRPANGATAVKADGSRRNLFRRLRTAIVEG
jgi:predicted dehydrogenase